MGTNVLVIAYPFIGEKKLPMVQAVTVKTRSSPQNQYVFINQEAKSQGKELEGTTQYKTAKEWHSTDL